MVEELVLVEKKRKKMVSKVLEFAKTHKLALVLLVVVLVLLGNQRQGNFAQMESTLGRSSVGMNAIEMPSADYSPSVMPKAGGGEVVPVETTDRMVITETNMSMLVLDVGEVVGKIQKMAESLGGFLVNSNLSKPEGAASGSITIRVPSSKKDEALGSFRSFGVKVVSENVSGKDVTDQYVDIEARMAILEKTKLKFEEIMDKAFTVTDLLSVQRELTNLQSRIDSLKGQKEYLEKSVDLSRITVYLSTDELALPYAPDKVWRPEVVFKSAVRSLVGTVRDLGSLVIWVVVYAPVWGVILLGYWLWRRRRRVVV
jgi:hypothetical protein